VHKCIDVKRIEGLKTEGINTFYCRYGFEVTGHPTGPESVRMAEELYAFIKGLDLR
jgi:hypothetical protein